MSISDSCSLALPDEQSTVSAGRSLAHTLYGPTTILLSGELGAGKTTFLKGLAAELGVLETVISPTFALEQRYEIPRFGSLIHLDLYRLTPPQARELVASTADHEGIRCIEWSERLEGGVDELLEHSILLRLEEEGKGRKLQVIYRDFAIPTASAIHRWQSEMLLPDHIIWHCAAVSSFTKHLAELLLKKHVLVRPIALARAADVHDLLRFIDFRQSAHPDGFIFTKEQEKCWEKWRNEFPNMKHEAACAAFLRKEGFSSLASIVEVHGLVLPSPERRTIEQKLLFYADKRVMGDKVVSLEERFEDFKIRYGKGKDSTESEQWFREAKELEKELFSEGTPT